MKTASVALILDRLETAMALAQSMSQASEAAQTIDGKLAGMRETVASMQRELQKIRLQLAAGATAQAPGTTARRDESLYYWEDDYDSE